MTRSLPARPSLEHLRKQAKALHARDATLSLSDAQHALAREYGFTSWTALTEHVDRVAETAEPFEQLSRAVKSGNTAEARRLLGRHGGLKDRLDEPMPGGDFGGTALLAAVQGRHREMVELLLASGADINARSDWWAGGFGVLDQEGPLVDFLIERGARVDAGAAARHGLQERLEALVAADPGAVRLRGGDGQTPLHVARTVAIAGCLLDHGADIDALDVDHESTPAQYLVRDRPEVAAYLASRGCRTDILLASALGILPLVERHLAADPAAIRKSVSPEHFPKRNPRAGGTIYIWTLGWNTTPHGAARAFGHEDVFRFLWERSPDDLRLGVASELGLEDEVRELLARRPGLAAELSEEDRKRLVAAAVHNNRAAVTTMLGAGWPVDTVGHEGATALHWAAFHGNLDMVRDILRFRPDLRLRDPTHDGTALRWAEYGAEHGWHRETGNYPGTIQALRESGAS